MNVTKIQEFNDEHAVLISLFFFCPCLLFGTAIIRFHFLLLFSHIQKITVVITGYQQRRKDSQISGSANLETQKLNLAVYDGSCVKARKKK